MRDHPQGVHSSIRPAGAVEPRMRWVKFFQSAFDFLLHAGSSFLNLPALVPSPLVSNEQFELNGIRAREIVHASCLNSSATELRPPFGPLSLSAFAAARFRRGGLDLPELR